MSLIPSFLIHFLTQTCTHRLILLNSALNAKLFARIRKTFIIFARKLRIMRANTYMSKQEIDKSYFLTFCIEQFKQSRGITGAEASEIIFSSGIAEYLTDNFEVLHTQSRQWLMEEIEERLKEQEL